eukprot:INCI13448.21.p1 GENE.INCI13448.21~~INCI13448.21.p1  ORF type:complete len:202 (-),score=36.47 INCI13448.21:832-1437(-)
MRPILQAIFLKYCGKSDSGAAIVQDDDQITECVDTGHQMYQMSFSQWRMLLRHAGLLGYRGLSPAAALTVFRLSTVLHLEDSSFAGDFMSFKGFVEGFFRCMLYIQYPSANEMDMLKLDPSDIMKWNQLQEKNMAAEGNGGGWGGSFHTSPLFRSNLASEQTLPLHQLETIRDTNDLKRIAAMHTTYAFATLADQSLPAAN